MFLVVKSLNKPLIIRKYKCYNSYINLGNFKGINEAVNVGRYLSSHTVYSYCSPRIKTTELTSQERSCFQFRRCISSVPCFRVSDYDCVGFDLDNTICEYNLNNIVRLEYNVLADYLVKQSGYDGNTLLKPLLPSDVDFLQRGLIIDTGKGNLLRTRRDGFIFKAYHGSKFLNDKELEHCYGRDRKWFVTKEFGQNPVVAWNGPLSEKLRTLADYFDMPAALALSRCVASKLASSDQLDCYKIWKDVLKGLIYMYDRKNFSTESGYFNTDIKTNCGLYYKKCSSEVIDWLKELKKQKATFLITGSNADHAAHTMAYCLGNNWRDYFDIIVCYSRKPGFFLGGRPFVKLNEFAEVNSIKNDEIKFGEIYSQGNWQGLLELLTNMTKKSNPKCLYIGDNLIQDVFTAAKYTCCDTIAVSEELSAELLQHPYKDVLVSKAWGPYFFADDNAPSLWGDIIRNYSKICVSSLDVVATKPFDYKFSTFSGKSSGYHTITGAIDFPSLV